MKILEIQPKEIDISLYKKRTALDEDAEHLITEDTLITTNGIPVLLYCKLTQPTEALRWAVQTVKYSSSVRTRGLKSSSVVFGYTPKIAMRNDYCTATALANNQPKQHYVITEFAKSLTQYYQNSFPEVFHKHTEIVEEKIRGEWIIEGTPFTSGIINKDSALKYHFDAGNFKGVLSNMVAFKQGVSGGRLVLPAYNIKLEIEDNSLTVFDGQSILHGVTPFEKTAENGYRYTIVYYSLEQMWKCETITNELIQTRKRKTIRENNRINPEHIAKLRKRLGQFEAEVDKEMQTAMTKNKQKGIDLKIDKFK